MTYESTFTGMEDLPCKAASCEDSQKSADKSKLSCCALGESNVIFWKTHPQAPGEYDLEIYVPKGGKISKGYPKTPLDIEIRRARELPGPGEYYTEDAEVPRKLPGGRFNTGRSKTQLEWTIYNAKKSPGPGEYSIDQPSKYVKRIVPKFSFAGRPGPATMPAPYGHKFVSSPYFPVLSVQGCDVCGRCLLSHNVQHKSNP